MDDRAKWILSLLILVGICGVPTVASADSITESLSVAAIPPTNLGPGVNSLVPTTPFALFNPSSGTLNSMSITLAGPATWTSSDTGPLIAAGLTFGSPVAFISGGPQFTTPGPITVNLNFVGLTSPGFLSLFTGTGTAAFDFYVDVAPTSGVVVGDTFSTPGLTGSITYNFTPATPTPEPSSLLLLGTGLLGLMGAIRWKQLA